MPNYDKFLELDRLTPTVEQEEAINKMVSTESGAAINGSEMATGKTLMAVEVAKRRSASRILIIAPTHTKLSWIKTFRRQGAKHEFYVLDNKKRKVSVAAWDELRKMETNPETRKKEHAGVGIFFITRELFRSKNVNWLKDHVDILIWDECHAIVGNRGDNEGFKQTRRLKRSFAIFQSATWFGSKFEGSREIARAAWPEVYTGGFNNWRDEWCNLEYNHFAYDKLSPKGEKVPGAFAASLPCYVRLENTLGKPLFKQVYVEIHDDQRKMYNDLEEEGIAWLREHPLIVDFPMVKDIRLKQITLGTCDIRMVVKNKRVPIQMFDKNLEEWVDARDRQGNRIFRREGNAKTGPFVLNQVEEEQVYFEDDTISSKYEALMEILKDMPEEKVIITTDSTIFASVIARRVKGFEWTGNASEKARAEAKEEFIHGDLKYLVAHPKAIGEGTDELQYACSVIIRLSRSGDIIIEEQLTGRTNRPGQTKQPVVIDIMAEDTRDDPQAETALTKELVMRQSVIALGS